MGIFRYLWAPGDVDHALIKYLLLGWHIRKDYRHPRTRVKPVGLPKKACPRRTIYRPAIRGAAWPLGSAAQEASHRNIAIFIRISRKTPEPDKEVFYFYL